MDNHTVQRFVMAESERAKIRETVETLTEKCWDNCMGNPGNRMDSKTETCIHNCVNRFLDSSNYIVNRLKINAEKGQQHPETI